MVKSLALGLFQTKAASEPPSWLDHLCDQTFTVRSSQLPYPWSARNTYCRNLDRNAVFSSTLGTLLGSKWKPDSILPTHTFPTRSRLGKSCLSPPTPLKEKTILFVQSQRGSAQCRRIQAGNGQSVPGHGEAWEKRGQVLRCQPSRASELLCCPSGSSVFPLTGPIFSDCLSPLSSSSTGKRL